MTADERKKLTSQLLKNSTDNTAAASNSQVFDSLSARITEDEVNRNESNKIASEISALTTEYSYISAYKHRVGLINVINIKYFDDPSIGSGYSPPIPVIQQDIQELWDGARLDSDNIFYVPTPDARGGVSQKLILDPTRDYDIDVLRKAITVVDPIVPPEHLSFGSDTYDLLIGYTEIDALPSITWAINTYISGQSGVSHVTTSAFSFPATANTAVTINNYSFATGTKVYLNNGAYYCIANIIDPKLQLKTTHTNNDGTSSITYTDNGNSLHILSGNSFVSTNFPIGATISSSVAIGSTVAKNLAIAAVYNEMGLVNVEISILQNCLVKTTDTINSLAALNSFYTILNIWYNYVDDTSSTGKWNTTNMNNLLSAIASRVSFLTTRKNQILAYMPSLYNRRANVIQLRLSKNDGTLMDVYRGYIQVLKSINKGVRLDRSSKYYSQKFILQGMTQNADNSKNVFVKNKTGFNINDRVYVISDDQPEITTKIIAISQELQDDPSSTTVPVAKMIVYRIVLADRISDYYTISNNLRLAKQLSE